MGAKQSSPIFDGRTRAYSSSDLPSSHPSSGDRIGGFRYTNGPDGPRIRFTGTAPTSSGLSIPTGGRSGSHRAISPEQDEVDELPPDGHRLLIGSLPAHLSPSLLGGKTAAHGAQQVQTSGRVIRYSFVQMCSSFPDITLNTYLSVIWGALCCFSTSVATIITCA